jgi:16S rRNA (uracil1498-N3)-methyltransferase
LSEKRPWYGDEPLPIEKPPSVGRYAALGDEPLAIAAALTLDAPFRFDRGLAKRLRMRDVNATEAFTLRDASGAYFRASVKAFDAKGGLAVAYERMSRSPEATLDVTLACAILARQRMHLVVQKAVELGVRRIVPLLTDHSVPIDAIEPEQPHAWAGHIARATKQCRRSSLPHLLAPATLDTFLASPLIGATDLCLFLDDRSDVAPVRPTEQPKRLVLFVGPEGGFSDAERERLVASATPWMLGGRVLRAETAALVGLAAVHMMWGDFR